MKRFFSLSLISLVCTLGAVAGSIPSELTSAFNNGDAAAISGYFNSTLELTLFDKEEIYSKTQAERILDDFFRKNPPSGFELIHEGGKESSKYAIGKLQSANQSFRITFLLKTNNGKAYIHQLRIEKENE